MGKNPHAETIALSSHYIPYLFCLGGRDKRGCPLVTLTQPKNLQVDWLIEIGVSEIIDMLAYFTSVPK